MKQNKSNVAWYWYVITILLGLTLFFMGNSIQTFYAYNLNTNSHLAIWTALFGGIIFSGGMGFLVVKILTTIYNNIKKNV